MEESVTLKRERSAMKKILAPRLPSVLLLLILLGASAVHPQPQPSQTGELAGCVVDEQGSPLPGVTVTLTGLERPQAQVADATGCFRFREVPAGEYRIRAELAGFAAVESRVTFAVGRSSRIEITLGPGRPAPHPSPHPPPSATAPPPAAEAPEPAPPPPPPAHHGPKKASPGQPKDGHPAPPPSGHPGSATLSSTAPAGRSFVQVKVFYGTDRLPTGSRVPAQYFGADRSRSSDLHLGLCRVTIPAIHRPGEIEQPSIWKLEFTPDPAKHMILLAVDPLAKATFFRQMSGALEKTRKREVLVFVHGFNVAFADAVLRTAQMAYDLHLDGVPVLYSWPSQASLARYTVDENNAEWTVPHLEAFLDDIRDVAARSGAHSIYLIAHSMGNRPLTWALQRIAAKLGAGARPPFQEILLTAPDIDAGVFAELAQQLRRAADRVSLSASSKDRALTASK